MDQWKEERKETSETGKQGDPVDCSAGFLFINFNQWLWL